MKQQPTQGTMIPEGDRVPFVDGRQPPAPVVVQYPFDSIKPGTSARFNRSYGTIRKKLDAYRKEHPKEVWKLRAIGPHSCRVWRLT